MTIVYGSMVEPDGMTLDDISDRIQCPNCGEETAQSRYRELCEGGCINQYHSIYCSECGHSEGDGGDDDDYGSDYSRLTLYDYEPPFDSDEYADASLPMSFYKAIDARCEFALAEILGDVNEVAAMEHLERAYSIAHSEGFDAHFARRSISPLMAVVPFLSKHWKDGVLDAQTDEAIGRIE